MRQVAFALLLATTAVAAPAKEGAHLPTALYGGLFVDGTEFRYTVHDKRTNKNHTESCLVHNVLYMRDLKAQTSELACDDGVAPGGVFFATESGLWWYDHERYTHGGASVDHTTMILSRDPKARIIDPSRKLEIKQADGAWCYSESWDDDDPPQRVRLCFANGTVVSGSWFKRGSVDVEFRLEKKKP